MKQNKKISRKVISVLLSLLMVLSCFSGMSLTAYAAGEDITSNITINVSGSCNDAEHTVSSDDKDEYTVKEGVVVTFRCSKWFTDAVTIYLNGTAVATWPGYDYNSKYVWTAKKDAKINWAGYSKSSANIYLTETSTVAVTSITLDPATADMTVGGSVAFTAAIAPDGATDKTVKWSVGGTNAGAVKLYSDADCKTEVGTGATETLTVYAKGIAAGSATVTVTTNDGNKTASCDVTVTAPTYTITWKSDANTVIDTTQVEEGETPTHAAPADYEDADYTYTFAGWTPEVVAATADATYTATFTATPKPANSVNLTVGNDITSNYYVDFAAYTGAQKIRYSYNCVNELEQNVQDGATIALDEIPDEMIDATSGRFVLEVSQAPAQMAEPTVIEILGENDVVLDTLNYSAKTYCDTVLAMSDEELAQYTAKGAELRTLCHTMIAYGQAAQGVFDNYETVAVTCENEAVNAQIEAATATANHTVDNSGMIKFSGVSFVCTKDARLRFYLNTSEATSTPAAPTASTGNAALKYTLNGAEKQYFVEVSGINAADFNEQITVNYGGSTINFSVLDFAGIVLRDGSGASAELQHFAKTLVVYNTNALAFFN